MNADYVRYNANARLYDYAGAYFVCSVAGIGETDSISRLDCDVDDADLGTAALRHLGEYRSDTVDHSRDKASDWAAFRLSGAKSIKSFERELWHVDLAIMNSAVLVWAQPRLSLKDEMAAYASANRHNQQQVGAAIRDALRAAKVLRAQGII